MTSSAAKEKARVIGAPHYTRVALPAIPSGRKVIAATCRACGRLLMAQEFPMDHGSPSVRECKRCRVQTVGDWQSTHPETRAQQRKRFRKGRAEVTRPTAARGGYEWTGPELEMAARTDLTITQLAVLLGRTHAAVATIRHRINSDPRKASLAGLAARAAVRAQAHQPEEAS